MVIQLCPFCLSECPPAACKQEFCCQFIVYIFMSQINIQRLCMVFGAFAEEINLLGKTKLNNNLGKKTEEVAVP